jgi:hypothetical protein
VIEISTGKLVKFDEPETLEWLTVMGLRELQLVYQLWASMTPEKQQIAVKKRAGFIFHSFGGGVERETD